MTTDTLRNAQLGDLAEMLRDQQTRKHDMVVPAKSLEMRGGLMVVDGAHARLDDDGVESLPGIYRTTDVFDEGLSEKLGIPRAYLRRMREGRVDLLDANVNGWLHGRWEDRSEADKRSFLVRTFEGEEHTGIARAFLSDSYRTIDHLDVLTAVLGGIRESGTEVEVRSVDLTDRRMHVKVYAPAIRAYAPELLAGYRSPFTGAEADANPVVFAGFDISNSETGGGAATLTPQIVVQVCTNGMTIRKDIVRAVHLGSRLDEGVVRYSADTLQKNLALITAKTRDAVATFLDVAYVQRTVAELSENAGEPVAVKGIETVTKSLSYTPEQTSNVLDAFVKGGSLTRAGVAHAITAAAQLEPDADKAADMEAEAVELLLAA